MKSDRIAVWHQCPLGNHFGSYADQNIACPACGVTEEMPKPKYIWDEWSEPDSDKVNSDTFPMLTGWDVPQVRGRQ